MKYFLATLIFFTSVHLWADSFEFNQTRVGECYNYAMATDHVYEDSFHIGVLQANSSDLQEALSPYFIWTEQGNRVILITYHYPLSEAEYLAGALKVDELIEQGAMDFSCRYIF